MAETAIEIREKVRWDICRDSSNPPLPMERTDRARARIPPTGARSEEMDARREWHAWPRSVSAFGPLPFRTGNIRFAFNRFDTGHAITIAH